MATCSSEPEVPPAVAAIADAADAAGAALGPVRGRGHRRVVGAVVAVAAAGVLVGGCGVADEEATTIEMHGADRYQPATISVPQGTEVVWSNASSTVHTADTAEGTAPEVRVPEGAEPWSSGEVGPGEVVSRTLEEPGVYVFACRIHGPDGMVGVVRVEP